MTIFRAECRRIAVRRAPSMTSSGDTFTARHIPGGGIEAEHERAHDRIAVADRRERCVVNTQRSTELEMFRETEILQPRALRRLGADEQGASGRPRAGVPNRRRALSERERNDGTLGTEFEDRRERAAMNVEQASDDRVGGIARV